MQQRVRHEPRISANKLGEYLFARPGRRRTIIKEQKFPPTFMAARYKPAREAILDSLAGNSSFDDLALTAEQLLREPAASDYRAEQAQCCADAIHDFLDLAPDLELEGLTVERQNDRTKLTVAGVQISVYPDLILRGQNRRGEPIVGALKLHFSKNHKHSDQAAEYVATLLRQHVEQFWGEDAAVHPALCRVVDVFGGTVHEAPKAFRRRWKDIEAACEEIRVRWESIGM